MFTSPVRTRSTAVSTSERYQTILLVDQDTSWCQRQSEILRSHHFRVEAYADGRIALAVALQSPPYAVICAADPLGITGRQLCDVLRRDTATKHVPTIAVGWFTEEPVKVSWADATIARNLDEHRFVQTLNTVQQVVKERQPVQPTAPRRRKAADRRNTVTATPPIQPYTLRCRQCDALLDYCYSHLGGADKRTPEQWDIYRCPQDGATYQLRHRTKKLTRC